jgi:hypothetical protein
MCVVRKVILGRSCESTYMKVYTRAALTKGSRLGTRGNLRSGLRPRAFGELGLNGADDGDALRWYGKGAGSIALDSTDRTRRLDCSLMEVERAYQNQAKRWGPR